MKDKPGILKGLASGAVLLGGLLLQAPVVMAQQGIPDRDEGEGPFDRLVLRNGYLVDGTGAPTQGPVDIVIENDRIAQVKVVGFPGLPIKDEDRPEADGAREMDLNGSYILPGFIDTHLHLHNHASGQGVPPEYVLKLWLSHGITSGRTVGSSDQEWEAEVKKRLDDNTVTGPRIHMFPMFNAGGDTGINTPEQARDWVRRMKRLGAVGIKFIGAPENLLWAALDEVNKQGMNSTMHHAQVAVKAANVLTTSEHGLKSMEHWYGLPEAMFTDRQLQHYPNDYIYNNEQHRFGEAGRLWKQAAKPGSDKWNEVMETLLERDFVMSPTMTAYLTSRDFMRMSRAIWHDTYTLPALWDWYRPSRDAHGSYWFYWTLEDEVEWKRNYKLWMTFLNEYKNRGGKVVVGSDSGYIYNLYGFGYIQEMELLREAGFTPLEVIHAGTLVAAKALNIDSEVGSVQVGKKADFVIIEENPLENLKVLFGTGALKLNDETQEVERIGGIDYTVKDGIVYNARELRADVRRMVRDAKAEKGIAEGPMPIATVPRTE